MPSNAPELTKEFVDNVDNRIKSVEDQASAYAELRETVNRLDKNFNGIDEAKAQRLNAMIDAFEDGQKAQKAEKDRADALETKMLEMEKAMKTPGAGGAQESEEDIAKAAAFKSYLRKHTDGMTPDEVKTLTVGDNASAGYLAPHQRDSRVRELLTEVSPFRSVCDVVPVGASDIDIPVELTDFAAAWRGETAARQTSADSTFGIVNAPPQELTAEVRVTTSLLEDSVFDIEDYLDRKFAEKFAAAEGLAFAKGTGTSAHQPVGITNGVAANGQVVANGAVTTSTANGGASGTSRAVTADLLFTLIHALPSAYARNGTLAFNRTTLGKIRRLKDSDGQFIFQPGFSGQTGAPNTILGYPYIECHDLDNFDDGTAKKPVIFGDFNQAYVITDRLSIQVLRDPFTLATNGAIKFIARKRVGGNLVRHQALRVLSTGS